MTAAAEFRFAVTSCDGRSLTGYAFDPKAPDRRFVVEALVDGIAVAAAIANLYCEALAEETTGDAGYGFYVALPPGLIASAASLEVRIANRDDLPGRQVARVFGAAPSAPGGVEWAGGLRFTGWLRECHGAPAVVRVYLDEEEIAGAEARGWRVVAPPEARPHRAFDLHLPQRFADGRVWRLRFRDDDGRELLGSPLTCFAFAEGLETALAAPSATPGQRVPAAALERLAPPSLPFADYARERERFRPAPGRVEGAAWGVAVVDGPGLPEALASVERQSYARWTGAVLSSASPDYAFSLADLREFVDGAEAADWLLFLAPGVRLCEHALARFAAAAAAHPDATLIYGDVETVDADGGLWPLAFPAFDYERMLEQGYFASAFALPRALARAAAEAEVDNLFRLANFAFDREGATALHLPGPACSAPPRPEACAMTLARATAAHLRARGAPATVTARPASPYPTCRVRRAHAEPPSVALIVAARDGAEPPPERLASLRAGAAKAQVYWVADTASERGDGVAVIAAPGPFSLSRRFNLAAQRVACDALGFLDEDVAALDEDWLEEALSRLADPGVGAVGVKKLWPGGYVAEAGMTLGVNFRPVAAFRDRAENDPGYGGQLLAAHQTGAVSAVGMMVRRAAFLACGGFDTLRFPAHFYDVDLCLKLAANGLRTLVTPHARLQVSAAPTAPAALGLERETTTLRNRWGEALIEDPSYSPLLALSDPPYAALAWSPRPLTPRRRAQPRPRDLPAGM